MPVEVEATPGERLPEAVELAAYFVVAEALTNVAKYASATPRDVRAVRDNGHVVVEVARRRRGRSGPGAGLRADAGWPTGSARWTAASR